MNFNTLKSIVLMGLLSMLVIAIGGAIGGQSGVMVAFVFAMIMNVGSYWFSDQIVLKMYKAQPITREQAPEIYDMVARLTQRGNLPMPKLYIIPEQTPNAFATGRDPEHGVVALTEGLLRILNRDEIEGVIAHELAHIKHRDILIQTIAAVLASVISMLATMAQFAAIFGSNRDNGQGSNPIAMIAVAIVAPIAAGVIQMAISRSREYQADEGGALMCGKPLALASALGKLETYARGAASMQANPATAHMFIINPLTGKSMANLFSTHPSTQDRIAKLQLLAQRL
ncbi:zinc metalloprotease HtpX [Chrysiogenes arsenatis]|uniref:zinc metalloprotease HtpX n=1 Tax=Chrysiogenes arsenatis TaxID=309797 RepID=UPI0004294965|nr:zinc metalloprotease HtpX [Chrysiogenes arsenatis]